MSENYRSVESCRLCHSADLAPVLDLGVQAINAFPADPSVPLDRAPLLVLRCQGCGLVQLGHTVARERLFGDVYFYKSGINETMRTALGEVAFDVCGKVTEEPDDLWLDIGANDGTLLDMATTAGFRAFGLDPVPQRADIFKGYFPDQFVPPNENHWPWPYKVITSIATFYASDDPHAYVDAIQRILHPDGVWVVQLQDHRSVIRDTAVDYFCHEHLVLWDEHTFQDLCNQHGLEVQDVSYNAVNGGSVRFTVGHGQRKYGFGFPRPDGSEWTAFREQAETNRLAVLDFLDMNRGRIGGLAASTKANTYLQWCGIGPDLLPWIADRDPRKHGRATVTGIPIVSEDAIAERKPDLLVALAWHFRDAFVDRYPGYPIAAFLPSVSVKLKSTKAAALAA